MLDDDLLNALGDVTHLYKPSQIFRLIGVSPDVWTPDIIGPTR
jgi:hypothetical protein